MCLDYLSTEKNKKKFLKEARKRGYIRVYKVCKYKKTGWYFLHCKKYKSGLQESNHRVNPTENYGWHAYLSLAKAKYYCGCYEHIITCYAKPSWLKGLSLRTKEASFTHLVFPDWDKGDITIREFREICKGK